MCYTFSYKKNLCCPERRNVILGKILFSRNVFKFFPNPNSSKIVVAKVLSKKRIGASPHPPSQKSTSNFQIYPITVKFI